MTKGDPPGEASNGVPRVDDVLAVDERKLLGDLPLADRGVDLHRQGRRVACLCCPEHLPRVAHDLAMRRMLLARGRGRIPAERHAEEVATEHDQHWGRHWERLFVLPGADVVRLDGLVAGAKERHRRHVPTTHGDGHFDVFICENGTGLGMNRTLVRIVGSHRDDGTEHEGDTDRTRPENCHNIPAVLKFKNAP